MAGFGSFMEGLQGGISTGQNIRRQRQLDQIYDQEITLGGEKVTGRDHSRARAGLSPLKKFMSGDPVLFRIMEKLGRGTGTTESPDAAALPTAGEFEPRPQSVAGNLPIDDQDLSQIEMPDYEYEFADGSAGGLGNWLDDEKAGKPKRDSYDSKADTQSRVDANKAARKAGAAPREAVPTQVIDRTGDKTLAQKAAAKVKGAAKYEGVGLPSKPGAGLLRRGAGVAGRAVAIGGILGAGAGGIRGALETETTGDGFWSDVGQRAVGAGKGVVAGVMDPIGAIMGSDREEAAPAAAPQEAIPSGPSAPVGSAARTQAMSRTASTARPSAPAAAAPQAVPTEAPAADPLEGFDVSKIPAEEIPNFSNQDWVAFREENIKELVANGMSYAEAWDKVDQQTIATQQRGFMHFAKQAFTAMGPDGKYTPAAAAAVRAAFQYLPSTTDIQVGNYNGHLVAFSIDEDTGEQVGQPMVVTPEMLQRVMMNFQSPQVWAEYAQDNRKLDQADRELGQGDRRLGLMEQGVGIERENAISNRIRAIAGDDSGTTGLKPADLDRAGQQSFLDAAAGVSQDPSEQRALVALMTRLYQEGGGQLNAADIANKVARYASTPEGLREALAEANSALGN